MRVPANCEFMFKQQGARRWISRNRQPKPNAILPLSYSSTPEKTSEHYAYAADRRVLNLTEELVQRCNSEFPIDKLESGFAGSTAVPSSFNSLLCVSGMGMDPLPLPVISNDKRVKENGLRTSLAKEDKPWFQEVVRLFFGAAAPANLHIRKAASSGFPFFTSDIQYKKLGTLKILHNMDDFLNLAAAGKKGDLEELLDRYHSMFAFSVNERQQPNAVTQAADGSYSSKARYYPTEVEARTGNYVERLTADMSVSVNGTKIANHFAMRRRPVFGYCALPNYAMTAVMACHRAVYLERFAFTYKARGDQDKVDKISRFKYTVGSDVRTMDQLVPRWFFEELYEELSKYWDERMILLLRRMIQSPYVVPPPWRDTPDDYNPVFGGSPLNPDSFITMTGLPSGVFINPDIGKLWMTFIYCVLFRDAGALSSPNEVEDFLQGNNPEHALLDMSDDACMLTNSDAVRRLLAEAKSPYALLEPESPVVFLGSVFCEVNGEKRSYPNPVTFLVNALAREDSIDRIHPVRYAEGVLARYQQYSATPVFRDLAAIYDEVARKHLGISPQLYARQMAKQQTFKDYDALVLANPHYLHYRVDPADVSPEVLDSLIATIPADDFYPHIKHLFKCNVI